MYNVKINEENDTLLATHGALLFRQLRKIRKQLH